MVMSDSGSPSRPSSSQPRPAQLSFLIMLALGMLFNLGSTNLGSTNQGSTNQGLIQAREGNQRAAECGTLTERGVRDRIFVGFFRF